MKKKIALWTTGLTLLLTACGSSSDSSYEIMKNAATAEIAYEEEGLGDFSLDESVNESELNIQTVDGKQYEKKLVYTCDLSMESITYDETLAKIKQEISNVSGFIQEESCHTRNYGSEVTRFCSLSVRVPSSKYEEFLQNISAAGSVIDMNAHVDNITQQYYDTETRIDALRIQEKRLLDMMSECDNVTDMIAIEDRLTEVQSELARYQTSLNLMQTEVDYSTVNIDIDEVARVTVHKDTILDRFFSVVNDSWDFFTEVLSIIGTAIVYLFPFAVVSGIILIIVHVIYKKGKNKKSQKKDKENHS